VSRERVRRATRLVEARERTAERVEVELAGLARKRQEAEEAHARGRQQWLRAASGSMPATCTSADLDAHHAHLLGLRRAIDHLASLETAARRLEDACRQRVAAARLEVKKIETWRDQLGDAVRADEQAVERKATDELGARIARGR